MDVRLESSVDNRVDDNNNVVSALAVSMATQPSRLASAAAAEPEPLPARRPLIVDALNKLNYFIPAGDDDGAGEFAGASPWELIAAMQTRVRRFVDACRASGFEPTFVVDNGCVSEEARGKWTRRKTAEVLDEKRVLPLGTDTLLCEMILAQVNTTQPSRTRIPCCCTSSLLSFGGWLSGCCCCCSFTMLSSSRCDSSLLSSRWSSYL